MVLIWRHVDPSVRGKRLGLFRSANGGSIFLDEITEMSPLTQTKLLRALQERAVRPVGSSVEVPIDIQLIASTNREPAEAVRSGQLRSDLYYRLQANVIHLPPLRERRDDIPLLVEHFLDLFNEKIKRRAPIGAVTEEALATLTRADWPGLGGRCTELRFHGWLGGNPGDCGL